MVIVKTWCENTKEGINYLKYNDYGVVIRISKLHYFCTKRGNDLLDVTIIKNNLLRKGV